MSHRAPTTISRTIGEYSKAIVALLGSLLLLLSQITPLLNFLPEGAQDTTSAVIAILTGIVTFLVKNTPNAQTVIDDARNLGLDVKEAI